MKSSMFSRNQIAVAVATAIGFGGAVAVPTVATAAGKTPGKYVSGDFHNHTTCSDGSISMQKLVGKSVDTTNSGFGLDWFVQAGHGGNGNRNCTLVEDASLDTPLYPFISGTSPGTTWESSPTPVAPKGLSSGTSPNKNMWRWQSIQEYQYPVMEYLGALKDVPVFIGVETVVPGHEHTSASVITGQIRNMDLPNFPMTKYAAIGNATAMANWEYCFDRNDTDTSRGNTTVGGSVGNNWNCSVPGSLNSGDVSWNVTAQKLMPAGGTGTGNRGHNKTVESVKWMAQFHPNTSYYVPAHLERAGPFNPDGNNGFNVEHLRDLNNAAPNVAFGFESQPGHGASDSRGEYFPKRQSIGGVSTDSVGGTTYGGTGVYAAQIGGVWDALLGEGRKWWFFASSDWHNRGSGFTADDVRSQQDFLPGEYQKTFVMVRNGADVVRPQSIVDGLRTGNAFSASGQLIDRLAFVACASYPGFGSRSNAAVEAIATAAATGNTDSDTAGCATMGEKLRVRPGAEIVVSVVLRDPAGVSSSPYTFNNPSLAQIGMAQPLNAPVLDHVDLIRGLVTGFVAPGSPGYAGQWPANTNWLHTDGTTADLSAVPAAAKNTSATVIRTFSSASPWTSFVSAIDGTAFLKMTYRIPAVTASQYVRLRGTNLPASVPYETDASGNPLADFYTNSGAFGGASGSATGANLRIPCTSSPSFVLPAIHTSRNIDGCPAHLATATAGPIAGQKAVSLDVAAWSDLWFYSNPIYVEVQGGTVVAGVQ